MERRNTASCLLLLLVLIFSPTLSQAQVTQEAPPNQASSVDDLIRILENEDARNALLTRLKNEAAVQKRTEPVENLTAARQIAERTMAAAEQIAASGEAIWSGITTVVVVFSG